jgi:hypothetical protein
VDDIELVTVFRAGRDDLVALAQSMLQSAEIEYAVRGDSVQDVMGWGRFPRGNSIIAGPIEIQVRREDAEDARNILASLEAEQDPASH